MVEEEIHYQVGIPESYRYQAAQLYDQAFGEKFALAIPDKDRRIRVLSDSLILSFAVAAISNAELVGLAGFQTRQGSLTNGMKLKKSNEHLGLWGRLRASVIFSLYSRKPGPNELLMDGIAVADGMRGRGIGSRLLKALKMYAQDHSYGQIRLDVIDTNPRARKLYERRGFQATRTEHFGYLRWLLGFGSATTMIFKMEL